ncbi:MAG: hypothetical protein AAB606_04300 [Patescibacteria group bacterium]
MPFTIEYNKDQDEEKAGRRRETDRGTKRELGMRWGDFEAGYRAETHTHNVDERREAIRGKVKRVFTVGFGKAPEAAPA